MASRIALITALGCAVVPLLGCTKRNSTKPSSEKIGVNPSGNVADAPRVAPLETFREDAQLDFSARHFALFEVDRVHGQLAEVDGPLLATAIHRDHVEEFIRRPGVGIGRVRPEWPEPNAAWIELAAASPGERGSEKESGKA